jgi:hypothetical protein
MLAMCRTYGGLVLQRCGRMVVMAAVMIKVVVVMMMML